MRFLLFSFLSLSFASHAVDVRDCPATLNVTYGSAHVPGVSAQPADYQGLRYQLDAIDNGTCLYARAGESATTALQTMLFTERGQDLVRVVFRIDGRTYWTHHALARYSTSGILVKSFAPAQIWGGDSAEQVGWANEPMIE